MVTLTEVARSCGLSVSTVSDALRGTGRVSPATIQQVQKAAAELGYVPNVAARMLRESQSGERRSKRLINIVILHPVTPQDHYTFRCLPALQSQLLTSGINLSVQGITKNDHVVQIERRLWSRGTDAVIIFGKSSFQPKQIAGLLRWKWDRYSVVKIGSAPPQLPFLSLHIDVFKQTCLCFEKALEAGYRRIAFIFVKSPSPEDDRARQAAAQVMQSIASQQGAEIHLFPWDTPQAAGLSDPDDKFAANAESHSANIRARSIDCVIGFSEGLVSAALKHRQIKIPDQVAFIGFEVDSDSPMTGPLSAVAVLLSQAVKTLEQHLSHGIRGMPETEVHHVHPVVWQPGTTLPRKTRRQSER